MFNNGFNNNFRPNNIAGINKTPSNVAGMANKPNNIGGINNMTKQQNPFSKVHRDNSGPAKQVMNSQGQNIIHNEFRGIK